MVSECECVGGGRRRSLIVFWSVAGAHVEDYGNAIISPGIVDVHVHMNEPGRVEWEGEPPAATAIYCVRVALRDGTLPAASYHGGPFGKRREDVRAGGIFTAVQDPPGLYTHPGPSGCHSWHQASLRHQRAHPWCAATCGAVEAQVLVDCCNLTASRSRTK